MTVAQDSVVVVTTLDDGSIDRYGRELAPGAPARGRHDRDPQTLRVIRELGLEREVILAAYVPDEDLPAYYSHAEWFVLPSLQEGFGLPPLEAMACGCPVVVSSSGSLPEVVGDAGVVVDATSVDAVARAMYDILPDPGLRADARARAARGRAQLGPSGGADGPGLRRGARPAAAGPLTWVVTGHLVDGVTCVGLQSLVGVPEHGSRHGAPTQTRRSTP